VIVKITTLKNSLHILQHGYVVKVQKSLHASFYDVSSSSVKDVVKHIVISSFYNVITIPTSLVDLSWGLVTLCLFVSQYALRENDGFKRTLLSGA
jgi:hypothetical protein